MKKFNLRKWGDEWLLAGRGILLATREKRFWVGCVVAFVFFGTLMNLLAGGTGKFELMVAVGLGGSMKIIGDAMLAAFGVNMVVAEWLPIFLLAVLQGILIGLIVLLWHKKRLDGANSANSTNVEKAGIITGLIALGAGCPTCGTTLLTPLLGTIFSAGGVAVAGVVSQVVTVAAVIIALLSLKRLGVETYVIMVNEKYMRRKTAKGNPQGAEVVQE